MNTQIRQYFARAKLFQLKNARKSEILSGFFISKIAKGFKKAKLATLVVIRKQHSENRVARSIVKPQ